MAKKATKSEARFYTKSELNALSITERMKVLKTETEIRDALFREEMRNLEFVKRSAYEHEIAVICAEIREGLTYASEQLAHKVAGTSVTKARQEIEKWSISTMRSLHKRLGGEK